MRSAVGIRGVVHVHTSYSSDGHVKPAEIAQACRERGLSFAAIADHAEDMDEQSALALVRECEEQSGDGFVLIPGLEHRYLGGVHLLAIGQERLVDAASPVGMLRTLAGAGCVLVAAHCTPDTHLPESLLEILTAVEIWNVSRHTRFLPGTECLAAYRHWAAKRNDLYAIGGLDLHVGREWGCEVELERDCEAATDGVIAALRAGRFVTRGRFASFRSRPYPGPADIAFAAGDALVCVRDLRNRVLNRA